MSKKEEKSLHHLHRVYKLHLNPLPASTCSLMLTSTHKYMMTNFCEVHNKLSKIYMESHIVSMIKCTDAIYLVSVLFNNIGLQKVIKLACLPNLDAIVYTAIGHDNLNQYF